MSKSQIETGLSFAAIEQSSFSLSYLGDAFYELWCRQKILQLHQNRKQVHQSVVQFVRCQTQARLVHLIMPHLTDEEKNKCMHCNCNCHCSIKEHGDMYGLCTCMRCEHNTEDDEEKY